MFERKACDLFFPPESPREDPIPYRIPVSYTFIDNFSIPSFKAHTHTKQKVTDIGFLCAHVSIRVAPVEWQ